MTLSAKAIRQAGLPLVVLAIAGIFLASCSGAESANTASSSTSASRSSTADGHSVPTGFSSSSSSDRSETPAAGTKELDGTGSGNLDVRPDRRDGRGARPARLRVSSIRVDATVEPIGLDLSNALAVPTKVEVTGWWSGGYAPGEIGPTVIVGHLDSKTAPGVFAHLSDANEGDAVIVDGSDGSTYTYQVVNVERLKKTAFPTDSVYGKTDRPTLRLVTCGGKFDETTHHYVDNVIVYADLRIVRPGPVKGVAPDTQPEVLDPGPIGSTSTVANWTSSTTSTLIARTTTVVATTLVSVSILGTTPSQPNATPVATPSSIEATVEPTTSTPTPEPATTSVTIP